MTKPKSRNKIIDIKGNQYVTVLKYAEFNSRLDKFVFVAPDQSYVKLEWLTDAQNGIDRLIQTDMHELIKERSRRDIADKMCRFAKDIFLKEFANHPLDLYKMAVEIHRYYVKSNGVSLTDIYVDLYLLIREFPEGIFFHKSNIVGLGDLKLAIHDLSPYEKWSEEACLIK